MATIKMTWTPTTQTTIGYEVRYALFSPTPNYLYIPTTDTAITIPGVLNGETYLIGIRAICDGNIYSNWTGKQIVVCDDNSIYDLDGYAVYDTDILFGTLYNWYTASDSRIVESGWHVASNSEWNALAVALDGIPTTDSNPPREKVENIAHTMKTQTLWLSSLTDNTNESEMNISPSGVVTDLGVSMEKYSDSIFWCSDEQNSLLGKYKKFTSTDNNVYRNTNYYDKHFGFNIRLVKDVPTGWISTDTYIDYDGNVYPTKLMPDGNVWLTRNLRVSRYNNGVIIPVNPVDWSSTSNGAIHIYE